MENYARRVMSGEAAGPRAALLRAALSGASIPYGLAIKLRNAAFDRGARKAQQLPRSVVSIGNLTTGGTGKTPVVRWLAEHLRSLGHRPAILSRGYKAKPGMLGDEQQMLADLLNGSSQPPVIIRANPSRFQAGEAVIAEHPETDVFLLDDGFQHRQLARNFDLVLINAADPFGFQHLLPRGLLREPMDGLRRASAFLMTRCDQVNDATRTQIRQTLHRYNPAAPVFESVHAPIGFRSAGENGDVSTLHDVEALRTKKWFAFCGIGDPASFVQQLSTASGPPAGRRFFADHHDYTPADVAQLQSEAAAAGADVLMTTEKDWVKLAGFPGIGEGTLPIWRADVAIRFRDGDENALFRTIERVIQRRP